MKKMSVLLILTALVVTGYAFSADETSKRYSGHGEVTSSDPVYSRVTIRHKPIQGLISDGETEFTVPSPALLKQINRYNLVDFTFGYTQGDILIHTIVKTGVASPKDDPLPIGQAVQGALVSTGRAAKTMTSPIPAVNQVVENAVGATTDTTEPVLENAKPEIKKTF